MLKTNTFLHALRSLWNCFPWLLFFFLYYIFHHFPATEHNTTPQIIITPPSTIMLLTSVFNPPPTTFASTHFTLPSDTHDADAAIFVRFRSRSHPVGGVAVFQIGHIELHFVVQPAELGRWVSATRLIVTILDLYHRLHFESIRLFHD